MRAITPTTWNDTPPTRTVSPTAGRPLNNFSRNRLPRKITRRRSNSSRELIHRPSAATSLRISPYSGQTPRTGAVPTIRSPYAIPGRFTVSRHACFTRGAVSLIMSTSSFSRTTFLPARCPPGCSLVCCGQQTTAPLPNALKPFTRTERKLFPYAISNVTVAMPHTMPSMVSALRVRFRFSAIQAS